MQQNATKRKLDCLNFRLHSLKGLPANDTIQVQLSGLNFWLGVTRTFVNRDRIICLPIDHEQ